MTASIRSEDMPETMPETTMRHAILFAALVLAAPVLSSCGPATEKAEESPRSIEPAPLDPGAPAAEQAALANCAPVTAEGYCGVGFGMSPAEARTKFPVKLEDYSGDTSAKPDPNACFELFAAEPVQGVSFLVEDAKVGRIDVISEGPRTADGFGVASKAADLRTRYGSALTEAPNKYEPEVTELTLVQGPTKFIFEIQDNSVRAFRAGLSPTIDYVEHCG
jgi:hypothetical protein